MALMTLTLEQLVNRAQFDLLDPGGQGMRVVLAEDVSTTSDNSFTLQDANGLNVTDVIEFGDELMLVTGKSTDPTPVITVSRGYFNTTPATYTNGAVGFVNPTYPRRRIAEGVRRAFPRLESLGVPIIKTVTKNRVAGLAYCEMPADCRDVLQVLYFGTDGRLYKLDGWEFFDNLPTGTWSTGKALNLPRAVSDTDDLEIVYRAPYRWSNHPSDPVPSSTIQIPEGAEDLPCLYAAAWLTSSRDISRTEIDRSEEWNRSAPFSTGSTAALIRARWQEFYRALDEARKLNVTPQTITYKTRTSR